MTLLFQNQLVDGHTETGPLTLKRIGGNWKAKLPLVVDPKPGNRAGQ